MKDLKEYLKLESKVDESMIKYEDVLDVLINYFERDDFDIGNHREGTGLEALENNSITDVIEYHVQWDNLADELNMDPQELMNYVYDNEKKLEKDILAALN